VLVQDERRPRRRRPNDRMQQMAADRHRERRQHAQHLHVGRHDTNLFLRLPQRRRLHRFAIIQPAARQRHLPRVVA